MKPYSDDDVQDGKKRSEWETRYTNSTARRRIAYEALYLGTLLYLMAITIALIGTGIFHQMLSTSGLLVEQLKSIDRYCLAWACGVFGGTLFAIKWLYHTVAHGFWHMDRWVWRYFTPHVSGGLAFIVVAFIASGMLTIVEPGALQLKCAIASISFLVGYFSDSALRKMKEIADTLFGSGTREPNPTK